MQLYNINEQISSRFFFNNDLVLVLINRQSIFKFYIHYKFLRDKMANLKTEAVSFYLLKKVQNIELYRFLLQELVEEIQKVENKLGSTTLHL